MSRRKIRLMALILIGLSCVGGGTYLGGRWLLSRKAQQLRVAGMAAAQSGDDAKAVDLLLQYIIRRPGDTDAIKAYIKSRQHVPMTTGQEFADTISVLRLLLQLEPDQIDDQRYLMQLYMEMDRMPEALDVANSILARLELNHQSPDPQTLGMKTQVLIEQLQPNYQEALNTAAKWVKAAPEDLHAQLAYTSMRFQLQQPADLIVSDAKKPLDKHPDDARWQVLYGFALAKSGDSADSKSRNAIRQSAMDQLTAAEKNPGLSDDVANILVSQFDTMGEFTDAQAVLQNRVNHGGANEMRYALAERLWEMQAWQGVVDTLKNLPASDGTAEPTLIALKALSLAQLNQAPEAAECLKTLAGETRPDAVAWTAVLSKSIGKAPVGDKDIANNLQKALSLQSRNPYLLYFLGDVEQRLGELDLAINAFGRAAGTDAHWGLPNLRMVDCLLAEGQTQQALDEAYSRLLQLPRQNPQNPQNADPYSTTALIEAWMASIANGDISPAHNPLNGDDRDDPLSAENFLNGINRSKEDLKKKSLKEDPILSVGEVIGLAVLGKNAEAAKAADDVINQIPPPPEQIFRVIANLSRQYGLGADVDAKCFVAWQKAWKITSELAFTEAIGIAAAGHPDEGLTLFDQLAAQSNKAGDLDWRLARAQYLDATNNPQAKSAWTNLRDTYPKDLSVQEAAAKARSVSGDWNFMQPVIDHLHALTGDNGLVWRLTKAAMLIEHSRGDGEADNEEGSIELTPIVASFPMLTQPRVLLAEAMIHMKRSDGAIDQLTTVTKLQPTLVPASLQLVSLLQSRGDSAKAKNELERIKNYLRTPAERDQAAVLYAHLGMAEDAVALLNPQVNPAGSTTSPSLDDAGKFLLAQLYQQMHKNNEAEPLANDLIDEQPTPQSPQYVQYVQFAATLFYNDHGRETATKALEKLDNPVLDLPAGVKDLAWGKYYFNQERNLPSAEKSFTDAVQHAPLNANGWQYLAICQMAEHRVADALATINKGFQSVPGDKGLAALSKDLPLLTQAAADGTLDNLVASVIENPLDAAIPLELIPIVVDEHKANRPDQLAARLAEFIGRHSDFIPARIALIQCYLSMDELSDAIDTANRAVADFPTDPTLAQLLVGACGQAGRWSDQANAAQHWKTLLNSPAAAEIADAAAASAMIQLKDYQAAAKLIESYESAADAEPDQHRDIVQLQAQADIGTGKIDDAAALLWPLASAKKSSAPVWRKIWMQTAESLPTKQEAVDWLKRVQAVIPTDALYEQAELADSFDAIGRRTPNDPELIKIASDIYADLTINPKVDAAVLIVAAGQAERCKQEADAENLYRRALALDPKMWVAQNDIAMLILDQVGNLKNAEQLAELKEAEQLARAAVIAQPGRADVCDTLAEVEHKSGDLKSAIAEMNQAVHLQPKTLTWRIRLVHYLLDSGDRVKASSELNGIYAEIPDWQTQPENPQVTDLGNKIRGNGKGT